MRLAPVVIPGASHGTAPAAWNVTQWRGFITGSIVTNWPPYELTCGRESETVELGGAEAKKKGVSLLHNSDLSAEFRQEAKEKKDNT